MNKLNIVAKILNHFKIVEAKLKFQNLWGINKFLWIFAYHRFVKSYDEECFFDKELISTSQDMFDKQIRFLKKYFNIINFNQLNKYLDNGHKLPGPSLILTFDDGYKDNYTIAYPILKKHNVHATIFLTTGFIGTSKIFWWDKISHIIKEIRKREIKLNEISSIVLPFFEYKEKIYTFEILERILKRKTLPSEQRERMMKILEDRFDVKINIGNISNNLLLNWGEVREMSRNKIEFGSHTVSHQFLPNLSDEELIYEISESKRKIETEINKEVIALSYPYGGRFSFNDKIKNITKTIGYHFGVASYGINNIKECEYLTLRRISIESIDNFEIFKMKLLGFEI